MSSDPILPPAPAAQSGADRNLERFRLLVENSRHMIAEVTLEGAITYGSPNVEAGGS